MATTIVTKYGVSPGVPPLPSELAVGELACNHEDATLYTKKADGTVIEIVGNSDPGVLPTGTDGDMLYNVAGTWSVTTAALELWDSPLFPGNRELALKNNRSFVQYYGNDEVAGYAVATGNPTAPTTGAVYIGQSGSNAGNYGIAISSDAGNQNQIILRQTNAIGSNIGIALSSGAAGASQIDVDGPVVSTDGTSYFAGIIMDGTNAGIDMQNLHRVFNHPDPSSAASTNVANARWVNNNYAKTSHTSHVAILTTGDITGVSVDGRSGTIYGNFIGANNLTNVGTALESGSLATVRQVSSDIRVKNSVGSVSYGLDAVLNMVPISFKYNEEVGLGDMTRLGFSAQDMDFVVPEIVNKGDVWSIRHNELIAVLVNAVQELNQKVEALS